jgi:5-(carboxyamino)imidazole ribonucleotide mutase
MGLAAAPFRVGSVLNFSPEPAAGASSPMVRDPNAAPLVGVVMGSQSDWETMRHAAEILTSLGIPHETRVVSAHRTPDRLMAYAREAEGRGLQAIIAGAGGAAHLPGMLAAVTLLPILGVPVESKMLRGVDSLLSIVQMPRGIPVGTLAIGAAGAANAGLLAAAILARSHPEIRQALAAFRQSQTDGVPESPE